MALIIQLSCNFLAVSKGFEEYTTGEKVFALASVVIIFISMIAAFFNKSSEGKQKIIRIAVISLLCGLLVGFLVGAATGYLLLKSEGKWDRPEFMQDFWTISFVFSGMFAVILPFIFTYSELMNYIRRPASFRDD